MDEPRPFRTLCHGFVLDISYGGAQAALIDRLRVGTWLVVFILADLGAIQAEVVWSWNVPETENVSAFEHGLKFLSRGSQFDQFVHLVSCQWKTFGTGP